MTRKVIVFTIVLAAASLLQACGHDSEGGGRHGRHGFMGGGPGGPGRMGPQGPSREEQLRRFDANADGSITRDEFDKVLKADFAVCDKNNDGTLDAAETRACNDRLLTDHNTSPIIDWNADGHVSFEEFSAQWKTLFQTADADGDGTVTKEEMETRGPAREHGEHGGPGGHRGGQGGERPGGGGGY